MKDRPERKRKIMKTNKQSRLNDSRGEAFLLVFTLLALISSLPVAQAFAQTTTRVSLRSGTPTEANGDSFNPSMSADGRFVAFESDANNLVTVSDSNAHRDIFVRDLSNNRTTRVSLRSGTTSTEANGDSFNPSISA